MKLITKFISVAKFAKKVGKSRQRIYQLIREHRLKKGEDYTIIDKVTHSIVIREDLKV